MAQSAIRAYDKQHDAHVLAWARSNYRSCEERYAKWEWLQAKKLAEWEKWEKKRKEQEDYTTRLFGEGWRQRAERQRRKMKRRM